MKRYLIVGLVSGILFGIMDGLINANPLARELFSFYAPVAKTSVNVVAGLSIDLLYGLVLAGLYLKLYQSIPSSTLIGKALFFGSMLWFLRVFMGVMSQWMTVTLPLETFFYSLITGFVEMLILALFYAATLKPKDKA